ncbi:hypothetical protein SHIRM173S_10772 [Streptomyces hirsutus]
MGEKHRLGVLEVGAAGHGRLRVGLGEADEGVLEVGDQAAERAGVVPQVHPEQGRDLVVPRAAGAQFAAEVGAEALQQAAFQGGVHVLVGDGAGERAVGDVRLQPVEALDHAGELVLGEQARSVQHACVRPRTGDVVGREPPVEVDGRGQLGQGLGGTVGETAAPKPYVTAVAAHLRCSSKTGRSWMGHIMDAPPPPHSGAGE